MEAELLRARIGDTAELCRKSETPKFLGFLSREESVLADGLLKKGSVKYMLFGGFNGAERVYLGCLPDWCDEPDFPIKAVTFSFRRSDRLSHRDFLGSLMALGIKRESVGDILIEEGRAVVFLSKEIVSFVLSEISKIGRIGVTSQIGFTGELPQVDKPDEQSVTVASLRLDCVVAAVAGLSRNEAYEKINASLVAVNSEVCLKPTRLLSSGASVSVRGKVKFIITRAEDKTRKNRIVLKYKKYS